MITRFLRTLRFLLSGAGTWVDGAEWTDEDEITLANFLTSETGTRLRARLRNASLSLNAQAVQAGAAALCGRAFGYMLAISDIQSLAATGPLKEAGTSEEAGDTGAGSLEHLNP